MSTNTLRRILFFVCCTSMCGLVSPHRTSAVELFLENDLPEYDEGAIICIENARSVEAPKSRIDLKFHPGESKRITLGNVSTFVVVREYPRHKLKYDISCPKDQVGQATITILDIHRQKLPFGCKVHRTGHWSRRTGMNWTWIEPYPEDTEKKSPPTSRASM